MITHRRTNVLDVVRAVTEVAPLYPGVAVWWYVPRMLHDPRIELLVEVSPEAAVDLERAARDIGSRLEHATVHVGIHHGADEQRRLFKVVSRKPQEAERGSP